VIERIFGVLKRRFKILRTPPEYRFVDQVKLVYALTALHNFIDQHTLEQEKEMGLDDASVLRDLEDQDPLNLQGMETLSATKMDAQRDKIAEAMWKDYIQYTRTDSLDC
jgi:hypothetical protein